jgi:hypothetical protein
MPAQYLVLWLPEITNRRAIPLRSNTLRLNRPFAQPTTGAMRVGFYRARL